MKISAVILTKNEEKNIGACLSTLQWCDEIIVVDDNSTDSTIEIAKKLGGTIYSRSLNNDFAQQRNFGLHKAKEEWVFFVDADERITPSLCDEIIQYADMPITQYAGFYIRRLDSMWGRILQHGETGDIYLLRLAKKNAGKWEGKVHELWEVKGKAGRLRNPLMHYPHPRITDFLKEINFYTALRAEELFQQKVNVSFWQIILYPKAKFFINYFVKFGFLDGTAGMVSALFMSMHSFLVRAKLWQLWQKE